VRIAYGCYALADFAGEDHPQDVKISVRESEEEPIPRRRVAIGENAFNRRLEGEWFASRDAGMDGSIRADGGNFSEFVCDGLQCNAKLGVSVVIQHEHEDARFLLVSDEDGAVGAFHVDR
jgi:hypothetical protein